MTRTNSPSYIQACISILLILFTFLPYISLDDDSMSLIFLFSSVATDSLGIEVNDVIETGSYLSIAYFMLQVINIFIQAHGSYRTTSCILSILGIAAVITLHINIDDMEIFSGYNYSAGFYLIIMALIAQFLFSTIITVSGSETAKTNSSNMQQQKPNTTETNLDKEIEVLKNKIKELENR